MSDMIPIQKVTRGGNTLLSEPKEDYPYGSRLTLSGEMLKQLGIANLPVNSRVSISAKGFIDAVLDQRADGVDEGLVEKDVTIQITDMRVADDPEAKAAQLYMKDLDDV